MKEIWTTDGFSGEYYSLECNDLELERWQVLNMCKQHSCELFGNLQGIFLGPDKIQSVCPCSRKWWWQSAKVSCMCLTETFLSSNVNKTKLAEYAKQACLYATGYYSRRLPHTNFATNSRGISVESRVIAQFLDTTTYTKTKEEVSNTILRRARPGHIRLHKPLRCTKLLSSRRQERVPTSHGHCWGQVRD